MRLMLDYSLPWDGRPRHITVIESGKTRLLPIGSEEERATCFAVRRLLEQEFGEISVCEALKHEDARRVAWERHCAKQDSLFVSTEGYADPYPLRFSGLWLTVYDFVEKSHREGKI